LAFTALEEAAHWMGDDVRQKQQELERAKQDPDFEAMGVV